DWVRATPYRGAGERCIGALSSMARDRSGRDEPADRTDAVDAVLPQRPDTDPISDEAESDRDDQPVDVHVEPGAHDEHDRNDNAALPAKHAPSDGRLGT